MCREVYGDANTLYRYDVGLSHADHAATAPLYGAFAAAIAEHDASWALPNLALPSSSSSSSASANEGASAIQPPHGARVRHGRREPRDA
jgi:hypothetical protein